MTEYETAVAVNIGSYAAAQQTGLPLLKTLSSTCASHSSYKGQQRALHDAYEIEYDHVLFPLCSCSQSYSIDFSEATRTVVTMEG